MPPIDPCRAACPDVRILTLPGWQDSGATHWQSRWEALWGDTRVVQSDWNWPRRGDWMARLDEVIADLAPGPPIALAAHSLGCLLVAAWSQHTRHRQRVRAALLVAPPELERKDAPLPLGSFRPIPRAALPFRAVVVLSSDDVYCAPPYARELARDWGCEVHDAGPRGHLNGESGLGDWLEGRHLLSTLLTGRE